MAVLLLTACDESKYELENLVPDEYHKVLYINNSGMQDLTLYNTGELNTYAFSVYKGGSDPSLTASVEIAIHSQEEVDALYGVNYRVIPLILNISQAITGSMAPLTGFCPKGIIRSKKSTSCLRGQLQPIWLCR